MDEDFLFHEGFGLTKKKGEIVSKNAQFRIASITKPFVATIVLQLVEEGKLRLDDKIFEYLEAIDYLNFENFHFYKNKSYAKEITIHHLLAHRSGLADIFNDKGFRFYSGVFLNRKKQYAPETIVGKYFQYGLNRGAHFVPGNDFYYSDMNYVLLGLLIQQIEGISLAEVIKTRILEPLNMKDTYLEFYESTKGNWQRVHQYIKKMDMTKMNTSFDWAGGGLVSTNVDLATFIKALFTGQLISKALLQKMTTMKFTQEYHNRYGLG
ncbi:MAG: serine hydrolase domain-containing protein [Bacteroidota bacterium]